jgi:hypothetical protein
MSNFEKVCMGVVMACLCLFLLSVSFVLVSRGFVCH